MAGIFLSYSREDGGCAEALARLLEQAGHDVWWDQHIDSGSEFSGEIEAALDKANVVLVAWSKNSVKSRWVRDEASVGGDTGRLVPVSVDGSLPPMGFRQFQTLDLNGWSGSKRDKRAGQLLQAIERRLKGKKAAGSSPQAAMEPKQIFAFKGKPLWGMAAAFLLLIATGTALFLITRERPGGQNKPTMALLPFTMASPDPELRNLAAQARDALAHALSQSGMPVRLLSSPPQDSNAAGDFLISGEVGRNADKIVATVRLDEVTHRMTIFSQHFEAARDEVRDFPERIGVQMAGTLTDGATLLLLDRRHPVDPAVLVELLADTGDLLKQYQISKRVAAKAPDVASAQIGVAFYTGFVLADLPRDERPQAVAEARAAADRGMALAPEFGDTYVTWCLLHSETRWAECEDRMRRGNRIDPDAPYLKGFLAYHLRNVGRVDEGVELSRLSYSHDPYNLFKIADMLRTLELSGDSGGARELYEKGTRWWPDHRAWFLRNRMFGLVQRGDFDAMARVEQEVGADALPTGYRASAPIAVAVKAKSAPALRRACVGGEAYLMMLRCMVAFATVGDLDDAYGIADKLYPARIGRTPAETERIWLDDPTGSAPLEFITSAAAAPVRRDPRYLVLAQRSGLLDYWRIGRMPDFCRNRPEPVCRQLLNSR